ncbi:MAG: SH3 domain-containing protein [Anaerolinea sp.]|nr:SH3 domain-containing protein [Anaerolinea sp.]
MRKRFVLALFVCLITGVFVVPVAAQASSWEIVLLARPSAQIASGYALVRMTAAGLDTPIPLPADMIAPTDTIDSVRVSPDRRFVALSGHTADYVTLPVRIADLKLGTWYEFTPPRGLPFAYTIGGFDPSGTRFSLSYLYEEAGAEFPYRGVFGVVDAAAGAFAEQSSRPEFLAAHTSDDLIIGWYMLGAWDANGIHFHPTCYACEPPFEGEYSTWNPDTAVYNPASGQIFSIFGDQLAATGEIVALTFSDDYPFSTEPMAYFSPSNVITYLPSAQYLPTQSEALSPATPVIFHDPNAVNITGAPLAWVNDGNAVLTNAGGRWALLDRTGGGRDLQIEDDPTVEIVGTPDGFVGIASFPDGTVHVRHYTLTGSFQLGVAGQFNAESYLIASRPALGASVAATPALFTPVFPNFAQLEAVMLAQLPVCPGFMPSRIWQGQTARVTPGASNNLRSTPTTSGELVGQLPGGAQFRVLAGPECADGTAWWYLEYNGQYGYTAEGMGTTYWVELVRP